MSECEISRIESGRGSLTMATLRTSAPDLGAHIQIAVTFNPAPAGQKPPQVFDSAVPAGVGRLNLPAALTSGHGGVCTF